VDQVAADIQRQVGANGAWGGICGLVAPTLLRTIWTALVPSTQLDHRGRW
jgi:hypothetical protein